MNPNTDITSGDRLSVTVIFALLLHSVVVLGVSFSYDDLMEQDLLPSLDVILVQKQTVESPDDPDYLAQVSQTGGGTSIEQVRPKAPLSSPIPKPTPGEAPMPVQRSVPVPTEQTPTEVLTRDESAIRVQQQPEQVRKETEETPTAEELIERSMEIARLEAEIGRELEAYAKRPRRKYISANTREFLYATYMQAWVAKVERIGNLNYPAEARRNSLVGSLVLTVAINRAGEIASIEVVEPSGHRVLDDAAIRIVEMGSPYAPLPENPDERVDILHITRTWQFLPGSSFSTTGSRG